jgi:hypothetical protein
LADFLLFHPLDEGLVVLATELLIGLLAGCPNVGGGIQVSP